MPESTWPTPRESSCFCVIQESEGVSRVSGAAADLLAPNDFACAKPKMGSTSALEVNRGFECHAATFVFVQAPSRRCPAEDRKLDAVAAAARTPHADADLLAVFRCENDLAWWKLSWQRVSLDGHQVRAPRQESLRLTEPERRGHFGARGLWSRMAARPSKGSDMPRPRRVDTSRVKLRSGV